MDSTAYTTGAVDALDAFGVRVASLNMMHRKMPSGPEYLGAEWLAKALSSQDDHYQLNPAGKQKNKHDRPILWSEKMPPEYGRP